MPALIGMLMLMGIVTKNAIMLVDFALEAEARGFWRAEAEVEGTLLRVGLAVTSHRDGSLATAVFENVNIGLFNESLIVTGLAWVDTT